jgi:hypothetical protein
MTGSDSVHAMHSTDFSASPALLAAALGGLLCIASTACSGAQSSSTSSPTDAGTTASTGPTGGGDSPYPSFECDAGVASDPAITSTAVGAVSQDDFTAQCDAKGGVFEVQPHCGGSNNCRGMSYDSKTQTLTEHSCRATNTCAGFSCVMCD